MNVAEFIRNIKEQTIVYRNDFFTVQDSPDWGERHKLGPVHFQFVCKLCGAVVLDDSRECDFTDPIWAKLSPHLATHA